MIKWLEEITVTELESQNYYHFHDNRVLPSHVDEALANKEGECMRVGFEVGGGRSGDGEGVHDLGSQAVPYLPHKPPAGLYYKPEFITRSVVLTPACCYAPRPPFPPARRLVVQARLHHQRP
jgi:hypothetical protein